MKPLYALIALVSLTACADMDFNRVDWYKFSRSQQMVDMNDNGRAPSQERQTDYTCVNSCRANGYSMNLCQSKCSY